MKIKWVFYHVYFKPIWFNNIVLDIQLLYLWEHLIFIISEKKEKANYILD